MCYCNNLIRKSNTSNLKDFGRKKANNVISYTAVYILYIFHHQSAVLIFTKHNENPMVVHFLQVPSVISGITYMYDCILEHPLHFGKKKTDQKDILSALHLIDNFHTPEDKKTRFYQFSSNQMRIRFFTWKKKRF